MPLDFCGKNAVVTGGANGIGLAAARALMAGGAKVWIFDVEKPPADLGAHALYADVADRGSLERAFSAVDPLDIVCANAGMGVQAGLTSTSRELWDRTLALNLSGVFHTVQLAAARMQARRAGAIVLTASTNSFDGEENLVAYNATKAGLLGILHTAANELGPWGIRVNAVCPGLIRTRLTDVHFTNPGLLREYFRHIPMGRGGRPEEVGAAIAFLASDLASYITGAALLVDGGQMASKFGTWNDASAEFAGDHWRLR